MPSAGVLEAGRAVIKLVLEDSQIAKGLKALEHKAAKVGQSLVKIGSLGAAAAAGIGAPFIAAIKHASDAQESLSRFKQLFGEQTAAASAFADNLAKAVGRSSLDIKNGLGTFQSFFVGLGFGGEQSRQLSQQLQALSIDFASFNNLSDGEALERFIAALSGSSEVLDKFGINIKQVALQEQLLEMGVKKAWTEVTEQEKAMARLAIIAEAMGDQGAIGNAARTSGSFANQMKALNAQIKDLAVQIGDALLPIVTPLVGQATKIVAQFAEWAKHNADLLISVAKFAAVLGTVSAAAVAVGAVLSSLATILGAVTGAAGAASTAAGVLFAAPMLAGFIALNEVVAAVATAFYDVEKGAKAAEAAVKAAKSFGIMGGVTDTGIGDAIRAAARPGEIKPGHVGRPSLGGMGGARSDNGVGAALGRIAGLPGDLIGKGLDAATGAASQGILAAGAAREALSQMSAQQTVAGLQAGQGIDDQIMHAQIDAIQDEKERRRALILFESELMQRELKGQGLLTPDNLAKVLELEQARLDADAASADAAADVSSSPAVQAVLDASFAGQQFGETADKQVKLLEEIRDDARDRDRRPNPGTFT